MRRRTLRSRLATGTRMLGAAFAVWAGASCQEPLDTTRIGPRAATLGDDIYGVLCDRVGASSFTEDLTGASYQGVCHYDSNLAYADKVDTSALPPVSGERAEQARRRSIAKLEAMARRRSDLVRAINEAFPDVEIDNVATEADGDKVRLHDALMAFSQSLTPLYESDPYEPGGEPVFPASTRALGRLFDGIASSPTAREALSRVWGRQGYRPTSTILGAIRSALAYPGLRDLGRTATEVLGPGGAGEAALQQLLAVAKQELLTATPNVSALPPYSVDAATGQPSRPRSNVEVMAALFRVQSDWLAASDSAPRSFITLRDRRGFALTEAGGPFVDADGDGLADVDAYGRFVDATGAPLPVDPPFMIPGAASLGPTDPFGRPQAPLYAYLDTSRAMGAALARTMLPLVDPVVYGSPGDVNAWKEEHESLMYALSGAYLLYGDREDATYDHDAGEILPAGQTCAHCTPYSRFRGEDSPLADLAHASGQLLADEDSDAILLGTMDLLENHEAEVARLVGAALRVREIAAEHDELAAQGKEPLAEMPYETPIWDEVAGVLAAIADRPGMTARLLEAFADDALVTPHGTSDHVGDTIAAFLRNRDELEYYPDDLNGPAQNLTVSQATGLVSFEDMKSPVDQTKPKTGKNRSCMQRSFQIIHDAQARACNKQGAKVKASIGGLGVTWPLIGSYDECELFTFDNVAVFYLDTLLPDGHPKRSYLEIKSGVLNAILTFLGVFTDPGTLFESSSGITGMTLTPGPAPLNRLVFFGASSAAYPNMPDFDPYRGSINQKTDEFVSNLIEPVSSFVCPQNNNGVNTCPDMTDTMRVRDPNTIFLWERLGFYDYLRPVVTAFANESADDTGEQMFIELIDIMNRHWPGKEHGAECSKTGNAQTNPKYCSEAGVNTYESLTADALETDLIPAIVEFSKAATALSAITVRRGPKAGQVWTGAEILEKVARILFSPSYAASVGMKDRKGNTGTTWVDGTPQPQVTVFSLFADALHGNDARFAGSADPDALARKGQWKRARSQLVDAFFAVEGAGPGARFKNRSTPRMLLAILDVLQQQLNANCPDRESTRSCPWARQRLGEKVAETLSGPLFAGLMDLQEALRADEPARRELERLLSYLLDEAADPESFQAVVASLSDVVQTLANDDVMSPILQAAAAAAAPMSDPEGAGPAATAVKILKAISDDRYDRYHVLEHVLPALVTPMDEGKGPAPIEVFLDTIAEVNRIDSDRPDPLTPDDYQHVFGTVRDFLTDETRGLEQFYAIVKNRPRE